MEIRAAVLHEAHAPLRVETLTLDPPRAGEVLVRVAAAGVCHSDVRLADGDLGDGRWPTVLGHEGAGVVEAVGPGVEGLAAGDPRRVLLRPAVPGLRRVHARAASTSARSRGAHAWAGTMLDGTTRLHLADGRAVRHFNFVSCFAERCVVPAASAVPIPPELPLWQAALLGCAVVTGFGAVRNAARVAIGESVCVIGCGGIGQQIVAAARMAGAGRIVAVDRDPAKLALARGRGATDTVDASAEDPRRRRARARARRRRPRARGGRQPGDDPARVGRAPRPGATAVVVGIAPRGAEARVPALDLLSEKALRGSYYGSGERGGRDRAARRGSWPTAASRSPTPCRTSPTSTASRRRSSACAAGSGARTVAVIDPALAGAPDVAPAAAVVAV